MIPDLLTSFFWSGDAIRSRSVSDIVLTATVEIPEIPVWLTADWDREAVERLELEPGDVETLSLSRARMRWPDYKHCVQAISNWTREIGLQEVLATSDVALMVCRGAKYHHDGVQYGGMAFCNLFLSDDTGWDLHFPHAGHRIPLERGTAVFFDTAQPHAVIRRGSAGFNPVDFQTDVDCTQVFLTWEIPIENADVSKALEIVFDVDPLHSLIMKEEQVWVNGSPATVCPDSGNWLKVSE
jgi:hypothetical protein